MRPFIVLALCIATVSCGIVRVEQGGYGGYGGASHIRTEPVSVLDNSYGSVQLKKHIPITRFSNEIRGSQANNLEYATGNGISVSENTQSLPGRGGVYEDEQGRLVQSDSSLQKTGSYSYTSPEGLPITLNYVADENGFRAEGAHLPKPVELPAEHAQAHREALARVSSVPQSTYDYDAPALRVVSQPLHLTSYAAPAPAVVRSSYAAPAIRVVDSTPVAVVRSAY